MAALPKKFIASLALEKLFMRIENIERNFFFNLSRVSLSQ
jgi:hypothetical protein